MGVESSVLGVAWRTGMGLMQAGYRLLICVGGVGETACMPDDAVLVDELSGARS